MNSVFYNNNFEIIKESIEDSAVFSRLYLKGKIQEALAENNNGRRYKYETLVEKILPRLTPEALRGNALFGESIHPSDDLTGEINPDKVVWRITEARMEGNIMMGTVEIIPESPVGKTLYFLIEKYEAKPGISSRGFGKMNGQYVDHNSYKFVTFDGTFNPSTHQAFLSKISESGEVKEFIKSFQGSELSVLSENSILRMEDGTSLVENVFGNTSYHIINKQDRMSTENTNIELLRETSKQVATLSSQLATSTLKLTEAQDKYKDMEDEKGKMEEEKEEVEDQLKEAKKKIKEHEDEIDDKDKKIEEGDKYKEDMEKKNEEEDEEKEKLQENYNKSIEIIEGLIVEHNKVQSNYDKSIAVLEMVESEKTGNKIKELVEQNLGKFEDYEKVFENVSNLETAQTLVESLKVLIPSGKRPTVTTTLQERTNNGVGKNIDKGDDAHESRVSAYSI